MALEGVEATGTCIGDHNDGTYVNIKQVSQGPQAQQSNPKYALIGGQIQLDFGRFSIHVNDNN
jgi:hypothetical protein